MRSRTLHVLGLTMVFPSLLIALDVVRSFVCHRVPLSWYLGACAAGVVAGPLLGGKLRGDGGVRRLLRALAGVAVISGAIGAAWMSLARPAEVGFGFPRPWSSSCGWRYCGRALGPSLGRSPFPVGTASCNTLRMCANEYPYSQADYRQLLALMREQGCSAP